MKNEKYIEARNLLIPEAARHANKIAGARPARIGDDLEKWNALWNRTFLKRMNALARAAGIMG